MPAATSNRYIHLFLIHFFPKAAPNRSHLFSLRRLPFISLRGKPPLEKTGSNGKFKSTWREAIERQSRRSIAVCDDVPRLLSEVISIEAPSFFPLTPREVTVMLAFVWFYWIPLRWMSSTREHGALRDENGRVVGRGKLNIRSVARTWQKRKTLDVSVKARA